MLGIILLILKIILWIILGILGLIVLIILMVLWVPIRYQGMFSKCESMRAEGSVTYLFRFIRVIFELKEGLVKYKVKIAFFTIFQEGYDEVAKEETEEIEEIREDIEEIREDIESNQLSELIELPKSPELPERAEVAKVIEKSKVMEDVIEDSREKVEKVDKVEKIEKQNKISSSSNIKKQKKAKDKKKKVKKEKEAKSDEESTFDKVKRFYRFLKDYENRGVFKFVLKYVWKMLKSILPKKMEGRLNIGTDDPATTGYILAVVSSLYPLYQEKFVLTPDFDGPRVEGKVKASGRIIIGIIVFYAIRIILDKRVRRLIKEVRK